MPLPKGENSAREQSAKKDRKDDDKKKKKEEEKKEPEPLEEIPIPDHTWTLEDIIRRNNVQVVGLKKDNKELRLKLKELNNRLTDTLDKLKLRSQLTGKAKEPQDPEIVHQREMENADKQIELYQKEINFLKQRNTQGNQIDTIKTLAIEVQQINEDQHQMTQEVKTKNTQLKALGNKLKRLTENKEHIGKMKAMIEEKNFNEKKIRAFKANQDKEAEMYNKQIEFMQLMERSTDQKPNVKVEKSKDDQNIYTYTILNKPETQKETSQLFLLDHPDRMSDINNEEQFKMLKEKVLLAYKSQRVNEKSFKIKSKKFKRQEDENEKQIEKLKNTLEEENRLYEQLVERIEVIYKELPQKRKLAPMTANTRLSQDGRASMTSVRGLPLDQSMESMKKNKADRQIQIVDQMKRIVDIERLQVGNSILIKAGNCENEIQGERYILADNNKAKLVHIIFW